jgi:putative sigma-54 modulation protein
MKIIITSKNLNASDHLRDTIEKKFKKLDKYFSADISANVTLSHENSRQKIEATINAAGMVFRAEDTTNDVYSGVDRVVDKLSGQMSKFKKKIEHKHKEGSEVFYADIPDADEADADAEFNIVKRKKFELLPMSPEEAVLQMELVGHNFFVFLDMDTDGIGVVYKRNDGNYGLLETEI